MNFAYKKYEQAVKVFDWNLFLEFPMFIFELCDLFICLCIQSWTQWICEFREVYLMRSYVCFEVLAAVPGDEDAIRCKVVALIKADSIEEARVAIQECSRKAPIDLSFFKVIYVV